MLILLLYYACLVCLHWIVLLALFLYRHYDDDHAERWQGQGFGQCCSGVKLITRLQN